MILSAIGGLAIFLIGIMRVSNSLDAVAGMHLRRFMAKATGGVGRALGLGTLISAVTQSGTALAVTVLGLISTGLVAFREGLAMSLGAKIGGTLAIQLAAFKIYDYALPIVAVGFIATLWRPARNLGQGVVGIGLLFLGLDLLIRSLSGISDSALFNVLVSATESNPWPIAVIGVGIAVLVQSSNAAVALALGLMAAGAVTLPAALALVVGGNVGSTFLPYVASMQLGVHARRVAAAHLVYKALFAVVVVALMPFFELLVTTIGGSDERQIANAHTAFNVLAALPAVLLMPAIQAGMRRWMPEQDDEIGPKYLDEEAQADPTLAANLAQREVIRVSDQVQKMMTLAVPILRSGSGKVEEIAFREEKVDRLTHAIVQYLANTSGSNDNARTRSLLLIASELEHMGDAVRRLVRKQTKLRKRGGEFSAPGRSELGRAAEDVNDYLHSVFTLLATGDRRLASDLRHRGEEMRREIEDLRLLHLARLEIGLPESRGSSAEHLDTLTVLRGITESGANIVKWVAPAEVHRA